MFSNFFLNHSRLYLKQNIVCFVQFSTNRKKRAQIQSMHTKTIQKFNDKKYCSIANNIAK